MFIYNIFLVNWNRGITGASLWVIRGALWFYHWQFGAQSSETFFFPRFFSNYLYNNYITLYLPKALVRSFILRRRLVASDALNMPRLMKALRHDFISRRFSQFSRSAINTTKNSILDSDHLIQQSELALAAAREVKNHKACFKLKLLTAARLRNE